MTATNSFGQRFLFPCPLPYANGQREMPHENPLLFSSWAVVPILRIDRMQRTASFTPRDLPEPSLIPFSDELTSIPHHKLMQKLHSFSREVCYRVLGADVVEDST